MIPSYIKGHINLNDVTQRLTPSVLKWAYFLGKAKYCCIRMWLSQLYFVSRRYSRSSSMNFFSIFLELFYSLSLGWAKSEAERIRTCWSVPIRKKEPVWSGRTGSQNPDRRSGKTECSSIASLFFLISIKNYFTACEDCFICDHNLQY